MNSRPIWNRLQLDTLRGLALAAVLFHHAIIWVWGPLALHHVRDDVFFKICGQIAALIEPVRMPLFTILSGLIYAIKPASLTGAASFIRGKVRRILLPLFFVSTITYFELYLLRDNLPVLNGYAVGPKDFWKFWFFHFEHLWFLQALFVFFLLALVIDVAGWMNSIKGWAVWIAFLIVLPYLMPYTDLWSISQLAELAVYFFFGVGLLRFHSEIPRAVSTNIAWMVFIVAMILYLHGNPESYSFGYDRLIRVAAGTSGAICLLSLRLGWPALALIGGYSYTIYLYAALGFETHLLFDDLLDLGYPGQVSWLALVLVFGVFVPLLIQKVFQKIPFVRAPVLGRRP